MAIELSFNEEKAVMSNEEGVCVKLSACSLGLALGILKGVGLMLLAFAGVWWGYGSEMISHLGLYYHGYAASYVGGLYGLALGFVCGFIGGYLIAKLYNYILVRCKKS